MIIDTNSNCTKVVKWLVDRGVEVVGRYYAPSSSNSKVIKRPEAQALSGAGIKIFTVFEGFGSAADLELTAAEGARHGGIAKTQARAIGQPNGSVIYFAVEGLPSGYTSGDIPALRDYFGGINGALGGDYTSGAYGDGVVCQTLRADGLCSHTWLAQASYSFEGSKAYYASKDWNIAQIVTDLPPGNWKKLSVDINEGSDDTGSFLVA